MKFRTEIEVAPLVRQIDHVTRVFSVGSCFAESIARKLQRYKFRVTSNPTGVLYNPFSIADLLESLAAGTVETGGAGMTELAAAGGAGVSAMASDALAAADCVMITFGTAWVYEREGKVVANCGKQPARLFTRRRLSVSEIVERFEGLLKGVLQGKQVIFTVSPIRHLKDGFEENSLSKAILRLAIAEIIERHRGEQGSGQHTNIRYFPAYEILNDDLRDYRFYGADLAHPSAEAVEYIWEKFAAAAFGGETLKLLPQIENIVRATEHRPFDPDTEAHAGFRRQMLEQARLLQARYPQIDLSAEIDFFGGGR